MFLVCDFPMLFLFLSFFFSSVFSFLSCGTTEPPNTPPTHPTQHPTPNLTPQASVPHARVTKRRQSVTPCLRSGIIVISITSPPSSSSLSFLHALPPPHSSFSDLFCDTLPPCLWATRGRCLHEMTMSPLQLGSFLVRGCGVRNTGAFQLGRRLSACRRVGRHGALLEWPLCNLCKP